MVSEFIWIFFLYSTLTNVHLIFYISGYEELDIRSRIHLQHDESYR